MRQSATLLLLVGALSMPAWAGPQDRNRGHNDRNRMPPGKAQNNAPKAGKWLSEHLNLSPDQRQKELSNDPEFKQLDPQQQEHLRKKLNQFNSMPLEQQRRMLNRWRAMQSLPPDRQELLRNSLQQFRQMPDDRRRAVRRAWNNLRQMPFDQQQQTLNSDDFRSNFNDQERTTLRGLLDSGFNPESNNSGPPQ